MAAMAAMAEARPDDHTVRLAAGPHDRPRGRASVGCIGDASAAAAASVSASPQDLVLAGVDVPGHSAALPVEPDGPDLALQERLRLRRLAFALPEVRVGDDFISDGCSSVMAARQ
jgi:hypothetical protein